MSFLGRRLIQWVMQVLSAEGIKEYYIIAHGKENRYQIKVMIGYGEQLGADVQYSPVKYDAMSTGSADSTLRMLEYWDISRPALVFPTDSIIDFDLAPMIKQHQESGAAVTIAAMTRAPKEVAEKYGVMLTQDDGKITEFVEKPSLKELQEHFRVHSDEEFDQLPLMTNAGFYLVDSEILRQVATHRDIATMRKERLDFGKDLLPWLVKKGYSVHAHAVRRIGDLGSARDLIETTVDALHGNFESVDRLLGPPFDAARHVWIAPESLQMRDAVTGTTLAEKIANGSVTIGPAVRIGRFCEIGPGVTIRESNLDDDVEVMPGAVIERSQVRDGAIVGTGAQLREVVVGSMSEIRSDPSDPTIIEDLVALGDEVTIYPGVKLAGNVAVYPRLKVPSGVVVPRDADVTGPADVLRYLA